MKNLKEFFKVNGVEEANTFFDPISETEVWQESEWMESAEERIRFSEILSNFTLIELYINDNEVDTEDFPKDVVEKLIQISKKVTFLIYEKDWSLTLMLKL